MPCEFGVLMVLIREFCLLSTMECVKIIGEYVCFKEKSRVDSTNLGAWLNLVLCGAVEIR